MKLINFFKAKKERGASMVEYAVLVALIALAVIIVVGLLGGQINAVFQQIINSLQSVAPTSA